MVAKRPASIRTRLHSYRLDLRNANEKEIYEALRKRLASSPGRGSLMNAPEAADQHKRRCRAGEVELSTTHFFSNQWNTTRESDPDGKGFRVFDWFEVYEPEPSSIRSGHYLDITPEMIALRDSVHVCGYCGEMHDAPPSDGFCGKCLDSPYLEPKDLKLTRLAPVSDSGVRRKFPELNDDEKSTLMPRFVESQTTLNEKRIGKRRDDIAKKLKDRHQSASNEAEGLLWLIDHGYSGDDVIYYHHSGRFSFGWRNKEVGLDGDVADKLTSVLSAGFPFPYDIHTGSRTISSK